jgi:hypothetical protein
MAKTVCKIAGKPHHLLLEDPHQKNLKIPLVKMPETQYLLSASRNLPPANHPLKLMNKILFTLIAAIAAATISSSALAQITNWTNTTSGPLSTGSNWDNGVPTGGKDGIISSAAGTITATFGFAGYNVTQSGGTVESTNILRLSSGSWTVNNGGAISTSNILALQDIEDGHQNLTLAGGSISRSTLTVGTSDVRTATFNMTSGSLTLNSIGLAGAGSSINISGGTANINNFNARATVSGGNITATDLQGSANILFNGGTFTTTTITTSTANFGLTFGGSSAGSLTAGSFSTTPFHLANRSIDWISGSLMEITITNVTDWAQTEWTANRMFFNGDSGLDLGLTWAQVIDPTVGFNSGGGTYFDWNGTTNTLALVTIPEPSTWALITIGLTAMIVFRRRRRA